MNFRLFFTLLIALWLSACARLDAPVAGNYRATIELRGGEAPFPLRIGTKNGATQLWLLQGDATVAATDVKVNEDVLSAQLPNGLGLLQATLGRKALKGKVQMTDSQGQALTMPFAAELSKAYRFVANPSTDNADISGDWLLEVTHSEPSSAPTTLHLIQSHDAVDGRWQLDTTTTTVVYGQVTGDAVSFSAFGSGRVLLFKGKVNDMGELQGELWSNLAAARPAVARRTTHAETQEPEAMREIALPWAVPTRELDQPIAAEES